GDGATHQGAFDLTYLRCLPNVVVMAPADENECRQMLYTATTLEQPAAVRYPRGAGPGVPLAKEMTALPIGRAQLKRTGRHGIAILAFGTMVAAGQYIADRHDMTLVNMRFVKPLDEKTVLSIAGKHSAIVTLEENVVAGGAGSAVAECLAASGVSLPILHCGIPDRFIEHGSREDCLVAAGLDAPTLEAQVLRWWRELRGVQLTA
ncbi:MAG TPA: transketolase C-terminal domain-containing protein, partial [Steroidobacteraceae bacterium]